MVKHFSRESLWTYGWQAVSWHPIVILSCSCVRECVPVELLLNAGADANINTFHSPLTLSGAPCCRSTKIIGILVKAGADVNNGHFIE